MRKPKAGVVVIANEFESGGERWQTLLNETSAALASKNVDVIEQSRMVWTPKDALQVAEELKSSDIDLVIMVHATWVQDTIQYIFVNKLKCPVMLVAVPYIETFSLACVQHIASILKRRNIPYSYVYSFPSESAAANRMSSFAFASSAAKQLRNATVGMIGPRQTWRIAGAQDMVCEEWDFSKVFGTTIVHIEMNELVTIANAIPDQDALKVLDELKYDNKIGKVQTDDKHMLFAVKVYMGIKELRTQYGLSFAAAQCYPEYGGYTNLAASILADEGFVLDTEGDISHAALLYVMMMLGSNAPGCLSEPGDLDAASNIMYIEHEGSSPISLADKKAPITINECGDGTMVGFSLAATENVTAANLCAAENTFKMTLFSGTTVAVPQPLWEQLGGRFLGALQPGKEIMSFYDNLMQAGADHHFALKCEYIKQALIDFCSITGIETKQL